MNRLCGTYLENLSPQSDPSNTFVLCFEDLELTYYIIDDLGGIMQTDIPENFIYQGT